VTVPRSGSGRAIALAGALAAGLIAALCTSCGDEVEAAPVCDGARPFAMPGFVEGETPNRSDVELLIERMVEVYGGAARLERLSWRRVEDLYLARTGNPLGNELLATLWTRPDQSVRTLLQYSSGENEERVLKRGEPWVRPRFGSLVRATGASIQHVTWDWEVARLPANLLQAEALTPLPCERSDARLLVGVGVELPALKPPFQVWIDPAGPLLVETRVVLPITADLSMRTSATQRQRFADWRRVDGVLFPHRRETFVDGDRIGLGAARSFAVDLEITDADLEPLLR
jgi:hypothetical protein